MSEKTNVTEINTDSIDESTTEIVVNWKALGKKVAIFGGILAAGLTVGYVLAQPSTSETVETDDTTDSTETPEV